MQKFLLRSLYFLLPLVIFFSYMEYSLGRINNSYTYKKECLEKQMKSIEVLVLGSSQATYGINPDYFSLKGFNLSNISQTLFYDTQLTLSHVDKMPKLKYVVITLSYFSLGTQMHDGIESWRDYYYSQFWDISYPELDQVDIKRYSKLFLYTPQMSLKYLENGFQTNLVDGFKSNGFVGLTSANPNTRISDSLGRKRAEFHTQSYKVKRFNENVRDLERLISQLQKRNITPIIITPPVLPTYYRHIDSTIVKKNSQAVAYITGKHHCRYFSYFTDSRFALPDFYDNDHLNSSGAEKFSKILTREIFK